VGTYQLSLLAKKLKERKLSKLEREKVEDIIFTMEKASFCAFGSFAVKGWKGIVNNFPEEIIE
jgi:NADH:ubiquinone oxidoreductase subunit F (NADH-binding)